MSARASFFVALLTLAPGARADFAADAPAELAGEESTEVERLRARVAELERERAALQAELTRLREELERTARERVSREEEWLRFQRTLRGLRPEPEPEPVLAAAHVDEEPLDPRLVHDQEIARALRSLLVLEEVRSLDLLEGGTLKDGATGPVVFRILDARGRPLGTLSAERLRLEGSRAARTLTLVLEDGYERRMGEVVPFTPGAGGHSERRIVLPDVDPEHWADTLRELFGESPPDLPVDDKKHDLVRLRLGLNELLRVDAAHGWWRLRSLAGVQKSLLREVQLEELDRDGRLMRRLFADRLEIRALGTGVVLVLEDGAQLRGDEKVAFLDGRFRIFLPRAKVEHWRAAGLPGLERSENGDAPPDAR